MIPKPGLVRLAGLLVALFVAVPLTASAQYFSLSGSTEKFWIGNGLPLPGNTSIFPVDGAHARQGVPAGPGAKVIIPPTQFSHTGPPFNRPVWLANPNVFQVNTSLTFRWPKEKVVFMKGGRSGPQNFTFCGWNNTLTDPPGPQGPAAMPCTGPGDPLNDINGRIIYKGTADQFGGPGQGHVGGVADVALRAVGALPQGSACTQANPACVVAFAFANPAPTGAQGGAFGFRNQTAGGVPSPGVFAMSVNSTGLIYGISATGLAPGQPNPATSFGAPWTTGVLTVSVTKNLGASTELFVLSGSDGRASGGLGSLSLVSASISNRGLSGPNANRGWLNLNFDSPLTDTPALSGRGLAAVFGLLALSGAFVMRRRWR